MTNTVSLRLAAALFAASSFANAQECGSVTRVDHAFAPPMGGNLEFRDCSADGNMFVGQGLTSIFSGVYNQAFVWSESGGLSLLNFNAYDAYPTCMSADGSSIGGHGRLGFGGSPPENHAYSWALGGFLDPNNFFESEVADMSADGQVIVGWNRPMTPPFAQRPYRWTQATGMVDLGIVPGASRGFADAVSGNGQVVVGRSIDSTNTTFPILWDLSGTVLVIGTRDARISALSFDGSIVVGSTPDPTGQSQRAFRWTAATGLVTLPVPQGYVSAGAEAISDDGQIVLGRASTALGETRIFRWTQATGMQFVTTALGSAFGQLGMSRDGSTLFLGDRIWRKDQAAVFCEQVPVSVCMPSVQFSGTPSLTSPSPFELTLPSAPTNAFGLLFYSSAAPARIAGPFGDLCAGPPYIRLGVLSAGGNPQQGPCNGTFSLDFNAFLQGGLPHGLSAGDSIIAQFWYRDSGSTTGAAWSNAVAVPICP